MAYEKKLVESKVRIKLGQEYNRGLNEIKTEISNLFNRWIQRQRKEEEILRKEGSGRSKVYIEEQAQQIADHFVNIVTTSIQELINWIVGTNSISSISHKTVTRMLDEHGVARARTKLRVESQG